MSGTPVQEVLSVHPAMIICAVVVGGGVLWLLRRAIRLHYHRDEQGRPRSMKGKLLHALGMILFLGSLVGMCIGNIVIVCVSCVMPLYIASPLGYEIVIGSIVAGFVVCTITVWMAIPPAS